MRNRLSLFTVPYVVWMALLVVAPVIMVVIYAFTSNAGSFTLDNFSDMGAYVSIFSRSFQLAIVATLVCLLIGYPVAYAMAKEGPGFQRIAMVLIMLPMWVNFLLRTPILGWLFWKTMAFSISFSAPSACSTWSTASLAPISSISV